MQRPHSLPLRTVLLLTTLLVTVGGVPSARAEESLPPAAGTDKTGEKSPPVLLDAQQLVYDDTAQTVTAEGDATFYHKGQTVRADRMIYDRAQDIVTALGHVRLWEPGGDVMFAEKAILSRDMQQGFVDQLAVLMTDNSRFVAAEGERTEGRYVRMNRALYTACEVCRAHPERPPLWQVRADRILHDSKRKDVIYRNATLELGGVPVFYTPYLSHPDPTVKRRSGFLAPVVGSRSNLGFVARTYYYLDVAPSMDATLEGSYSDKHGALVGAEWRYRGMTSDVRVHGSLTQDDIPNDVAGSPPTRQALRGHIFVDATTTFNPNWRASLTLRRTTDDTYPDLWSFTAEDILTSRAQVERYGPRSRGVAEVISFQDLRPGITEAEPQVMHAGWSAQGAPHSLWGGRWRAGTDARAIARSHGLDSTRASFSAGWRREDILPKGLVLTQEALARLDGFAAQNMGGVRGEDETALRPFAQGQLTARWPWINVRENGHQFLEPLAQLSVAPRQKRKPSDIANEDSIGVEFDPTNLFTPNRYAGYDRLDGGQRFAYGLQGGWMGLAGAGLTAMIGQSHDLARHPVYPVNSGLETPSSDIVGSLNALVPGWLDAAYSTRLRSDTFEPREHDLMITAGPAGLQGSVGYLYAEQPAVGAIATDTRQEMTVGGRWAFRPHWTISGSHRHDLERSDGALATALNLVYQDECLTFSLVAQRDHVARSGLASGDSIFFRLIFKNIGEFESPNLSTDVFGNSGL